MSYTLAYKGAEIDEILGRAATGGALDTAIAAKQDALTFDDTPESGSDNPVKSGGIYDAIQAGGAAALAAFPTDSVSGDVVSFSDGADSIPVKAFTGSIIPQQNLNGQASPYPAGGGKNKINSEATSATHNGITYTVNSDYIISASGTASGGLSVKNIINGKTLAQANLVEGTSYILNGCPSGGSASGYYLRLALTTSGGTTNYTDTGSGVTFTVPSGVTSVRIYIGISVGVSVSNLVFKPMIRLATEADATFAPYANICPISGWTGANIYRMGANVWDEQWELGSIDNSGNFTGGTSTFRVKAKIPVVGGENYALVYGSIAAPTRTLWAYWYDSNGALIGSRVEITASPTTITAPPNAVSLAFRTGGNAPATTYNHDISVNYPSTVTTYQPYNGSTILLSFGDTVYAGTLTALGGGLWQVQPTHKAVDMGSLSWTYDSVNTRFWSDGVASEIVKPATWGANALCSMFGGATGNPPNGRFSIYASGRLYVKDTQYTTEAAFTTAVTGQTFLYQLATLPDPIIVSAEDLQTLLGANTVWLDCGSVTELTYRADTALYIDKKLGA